MGDTAQAVCRYGVLHGEGVVAERLIREAHGGLDAVDLVIRDDNVVVQQIVPVVRGLVVVGVGHVGENVGEGFLRVLVELALAEIRALLVDLPEAQVGGAVLGMLGRGDKLQVPVVIQVGDAVIPGHLPLGLLEPRRLGLDEGKLPVNVGRLHRDLRDFHGKG